MRARFLIVIAGVAVCGLMLLSLRQQRIAVINEISALHRELDASREDLWKARADVARHTRPAALDAKIGEEWTAAVPGMSLEELPYDLD
jgi:hypothetical protein